MTRLKDFERKRKKEQEEQDTSKDVFNLRRSNAFNSSREALENDITWRRSRAPLKNPGNTAPKKKQKSKMVGNTKLEIAPLEEDNEMTWSQLQKDFEEESQSQSSQNNFLPNSLDTQKVRCCAQKVCLPLLFTNSLTTYRTQ